MCAEARGRKEPGPRGSGELEGAGPGRPRREVGLWRESLSEGPALPGKQDGEGLLARDVHVSDSPTRCSVPGSLPPGLAVYLPRLHPSAPRAARLPPGSSDHAAASLSDDHLQERRLHSESLRGGPGVWRVCCAWTCTLLCSYLAEAP